MNTSPTATRTSNFRPIDGWAKLCPSPRMSANEGIISVPSGPIHHTLTPRPGTRKRLPDAISA